MNTSLLLLYIIVIGVYNIWLNISRRKGKQVNKKLVIAQVVLNLILAGWGLLYLFFG
ncbi:hypothetical protein [Enterococcus pallens]|uniref:Uncharacterized protein n=1 Tax=Enterococcus pallens ATCC BAA-351 TaxID=1158607 RepID=R2SNQ8_9ENTE|nr:hypothetical protein [Enterococcus pallens]EOH94451.1 hypothetical protein UAU_02186 [Enterococcus pallens ATCC BAA-351]EOU24330.1 hypothetical protein I588_00317 [Enterococcus pallens ATCC BAA-351]OJG81888.1 hypothetical protein RV10_GL001752 [Enterococcus pallens]